MKKASFNPANEIFFFVATPNYSYSGPKKKRVQQRKSRVKQASKKKQVQLAENARELKLSVTPVRLARSSAHKMQEGNAEAVCLPPEVKFSEGVGGETVWSGDCRGRYLDVKSGIKKGISEKWDWAWVMSQWGRRKSGLSGGIRKHIFMKSNISTSKNFLSG